MGYVGGTTLVDLFHRLNAGEYFTMPEGIIESLFSCVTIKYSSGTSKGGKMPNLDRMYSGVFLSRSVRLCSSPSECSAEENAESARLWICS